MSEAKVLQPISAAELLQQPRLDVKRWASEQLTSRIFDVLGHFLLAQRSSHTRSAYARDVLEFLVFAESVGPSIRSVTDISERKLLLWKDHLQQKHSRFDESKRRVANASVARKLCTLSSLLDFALKRKLIPENPMELVKRPTVRRQSHASVLTEDELALILQHAREQLSQDFSGNNQSSDASRKTSSSTRRLRAELKAHTEWCVMVLLFTVGMRVSELCQLRLQDVTADGDLLRLSLIAKGARKHTPLIHPESAKVLTSFISNFRAGASPEEPIFPAGRASNGKTLPIHRSTVFRIVRDAARRAGITRPFSPHGCRATLATQLHLAEIPVVEIQSLLNHAQVTTTQLYLHRVDELKEAAALRLPWVQNPPK